MREATISTEDLCKLDEVEIDALLPAPDVFGGSKLDFVVYNTHHDIGMPFHKGIDRCNAKSTRQHPIPGRRRSTALRMSQNADAQIDLVKLDIGSHGIRYLGCTAELIPLGDNHDGTAVLGRHQRMNVAFYVIYVVEGLGYQNHLSTATNTAVQGNEAGVPAHDFHKEQPIVGIGGIADTINILQSRIQGRVEADGFIRTKQIIVDRTGASNNRDSILVEENSGPLQRPISPDRDQSIHTVAFQLLSRPRSSLRRTEFCGTRTFQDGPPFLDDVGHRLGVHLHHVTFNHALVSSANAHDFQVVRNGCTYYGPDTCIHARRIPSRCKNSNSTHGTLRTDAFRQGGRCEVKCAIRTICSRAGLNICRNTRLQAIVDTTGRQYMLLPLETPSTYAMPDTKSPYRVQLDDNAAVPVDPAKHAPETSGLTHVRDRHYLLRVEGRSIPVTIETVGRKSFRLWTGNRVFDAQVQDERDQMLEAWGFADGSDSDLHEMSAPMPGLVLSVLISDGEHVEAGQPLLVLEAMKMENELRAENSATVRKVHVQAGDAVMKAQVLIEFES